MSFFLSFLSNWIFIALTYHQWTNSIFHQNFKNSFLSFRFQSTLKCKCCTISLMIGRFFSSHFKLKRAFSNAASRFSFDSSPFSLINLWIRSICWLFVKTDASFTKVVATFESDANLKVSIQIQKYSFFINQLMIDATYAVLMSLCRVRMKSMTKSWFCFCLQVDGRALVLYLNGTSSERIKSKYFWKWNGKNRWYWVVTNKCITWSFSLPSISRSV